MRHIAFAGFLFVSALSLRAANDPASSILGTWKGTSICVKIPENSYCHDEVVVYEFARDGADKVLLHAYKVIDGKNEWMGDIAFTFDPKSGEWLGPFKGRRGEILWSYKVSGETMTGSCVLIPSKTKVRDVKAHR